MKKTAAALVAAAVLTACASAPLTDPRALAAAQAADPGCSAPVLVSTGGAFPRDPATLAIRWAGFTNFETGRSSCSTRTTIAAARFRRSGFAHPT